MPGIFSYAGATNPAMVTGGTKGPAADRGQAASLPSARAAVHNFSPDGEFGAVANREEFQAFGRIFS
jgi:hypothetical protein